MGKRLLLFYCLLLSLTVGAENQRPPKVFVDKGACPFECCIYRRWLANKDVSIFNDLKKTKLIKKVKKGDVVTATTGEVHTVPALAKVTFAKKGFVVGEKVYLLNYLGEGFQKIWRKGEIIQEDLAFLYSTGSRNLCEKPNKDCWLKKLGKENSIWWSKVTLEDGQEGWTDQGKDFSNIDACAVSEAEIKAWEKKDFSEYCKLIECKHSDCGCDKISKGWKVKDFCHGAKWKYLIEKNDEQIVCKGEKQIKGPIEKSCHTLKEKSQSTFKCT